MIIVQVSGGLGNQMFQYAFGRALASRSGAELALDLSFGKARTYRRFQLPRVFSLSAPLATAVDKKKILGCQCHPVVRRVLKKVGAGRLLSSRYIEEPHFHFAPQLMEAGDDVYLSGYWQSEKYFDQAAELIRKDFTFRRPLSLGSFAVRRKIQEVGPAAVSVHVRRGDYLSDPATRRVHGTCGAEYYRAAVAHLAARVPKPTFFIFSDDMARAKELFTPPFPCVFVERKVGEQDWEDLCLMSHCRHHIIANSTFSWWGAWLNRHPDKLVVAPAKWFAVEREAKDLFPPGWLAL